MDCTVVEFAHKTLIIRQRHSERRHPGTCFHQPSQAALALTSLIRLEFLDPIDRRQEIL